MCGIGNVAEVIDILYVFGEILVMSYFDMVTAGFKMNYGIILIADIMADRFFENSPLPS